MNSKNTLFQLLIVSLIVCIMVILIGNVYALDANPDDSNNNISLNTTEGDDNNNNIENPPTGGGEDNPIPPTSGGEDDHPTEPEWTDISNVKFTIETINDEFALHRLSVSGLSRKENHFYYAVLSNSPTLDTSAILNNPANYDGFLPLLDNSNYFNSYVDKYIEKNGDIYIWFFDHVVDYDYTIRTKELISAKKLERPSTISVGLRMQGYFFQDSSSLFVKAFAIQEGRKMYVQIGNITDIEILKAIRDGKSGSFNSLLNYAKSAQSFYTNTFVLDNSLSPNTKKDVAITANLPIVEKGFYYVYMRLEDENGTYYPLEDVGLYQGLCRR